MSSTVAKLIQVDISRTFKAEERALDRSQNLLIKFSPTYSVSTSVERNEFVNIDLLLNIV